MDKKILYQEAYLVFPLALPFCNLKILDGKYQVAVHSYSTALHNVGTFWYSDLTDTKMTSSTCKRHIQSDGKSAASIRVSTSL